MKLVDTPQALADLADRFSRAEALGVDTEFVRERTFYPGLGLVQLSDGDEVALVDPVALDDLEPLRRLFADPGIVKVLHSCSEDMEVFYHRFGELPRRLFDTQVAAAFLGYGYSVSYGQMVSELHGVDLPKGETRTNWLKRPLRPAQLEYAVQDVAYLVPSWRRLEGELEEAGRLAWVEEELAALSQDTGRFGFDPREAYLRVRHPRGLPRRELAVLRELAAWREEEARRRDLPRNFVLPEPSLARLARVKPRRQEELATVRELRPGDVRRHGRRILGLVERALDLAPEELPPEPKPYVDLKPHREKVDALRREVASVAAELDLPPELLATRKTVEAMVRRFVSGKDDPLPRELRGWRREVVGERLLAVLDA